MNAVETLCAGKIRLKQCLSAEVPDVKFETLTYSYLDDLATLSV